MRLRATHFACVLLLLSSFGATEASTLQSMKLGLGGQYIAALLQQTMAADDAVAVLGEGSFDRVCKELEPGSLAVYRAAWTMRPPAAQTAELQAVTANGTERL